VTPDSSEDEMRSFDVRIGINENVDNLVIDINGNKNVAGAGINNAQRIMSTADGRQLMAGQTVYEILSQREKYMNSFREYSAKIKHDLIISVYQYADKSHPGLSDSLPSMFIKPKPLERRLSKLEAYYLAHSLKNREFLIQHCDNPTQSNALTILIWFLAKDSFQLAEKKEHQKALRSIIGGGKLSFEEAFKQYMSINFWLIWEIAKLMKTQLSDIRPFLESSVDSFYFVNDKGKQKLKTEYPDIWKEFEFEEGT